MTKVLVHKQVVAAFGDSVMAYRGLLRDQARRIQMNPVSYDMYRDKLSAVESLAEELGLREDILAYIEQKEKT